MNCVSPNNNVSSTLFLMRFSKTQIGLLAALLFGNAIVLYSNLQWFWLRFPTALALSFILAGWAWLPALGWMQTQHALERLVLIIGLSSLLSALALLIALLLPGPFTETPALIPLNLATLTGLLCQSIPYPHNPKPKTQNPRSKTSNPN